MHADAFDRYHHGQSPLHSLDPRIKVIVTIAFILSNALLPDGAWIAFLLAWCFILFATVMSGLGAGFTFKLFAPMTSKPPSWKSNPCTVITAVITSIAAHGPSMIAASAPPDGPHQSRAAYA